MGRRSKETFRGKKVKRVHLRLNQDLIPGEAAFIYLIPLRDGKVCRLSPGTGKPKKKKKKEQRGLGGGEGVPPRKEKEEERKRRGLEGAAGEEAPGCSRLCCPSFPTLKAAQSPSNWLARAGEGWCCTRFGKNSLAAAWGLPIEPCCMAQGHGVSLCTRSSLRALPMGIRRQSHALVSASSSSLFWAINNSLSTAFPKERGTRSCPFLPLWIYQRLLALSL